MKRFAIVGLPLLFITIARALGQPTQVVSPRCTTFVRSEPTMPGWQQELFKNNGNAIMSCRIASGDSEIFVLSPVMREDRGTCSFTATIQRQRDSETNYTRELSEPTLFMLLTGPTCPDQRDPRYVPTYEISPREFADISGVWQRASSSDAELGKVLDHLREKKQLWLDSIQADTLRKAVNDNTLQLVSVSKVPQLDRAVVGKGYVLLMRDKTAHTDQYSIYIGFDADHAQVNAISPAFR